MRKKFIFHLNDQELFEKKMISYSKELSHSCILHSNITNTNVPKKYYQYDLICAFESVKELSVSTDSLNKLETFYNKNKDWMFGYISYDLRNEIFNNKSENPDYFGNNNLSFFIPKHVFLIKDQKLVVESIEDKQSVAFCLEKIFNYDCACERIPKFNFSSRETKKSYLNKITKIKNHIQRGDIYEMNYCQEFYKENIFLPTQSLFIKLNNLTKSPFATFLNIENFTVIGTSPERYILKQGENIISQPIKGTSKRVLNTDRDNKLKKKLSESSKDISENIMIVDLVRNDLSVTAKEGSVKVDRLCGVYSFSHVHQMISTISSKLKDKNKFIDVIATTFPMGSMTGAPKIRAMELIDQYEEVKRGVYSGSVGYINPIGDFDFNVIIRSLLYDSQKKYLSLTVGGAIVSKSEAIKEYEECLIKAKPIFDFFN
tara:strand:- start:6761 stop:8050 length:1290 start_codon:yes stop_codon:yes gene_type:complete